MRTRLSRHRSTPAPTTTAWAAAGAYRRPHLLTRARSVGQLIPGRTRGSAWVPPSLLIETEAAGGERVVLIYRPRQGDYTMVFEMTPRDQVWAADCTGAERGSRIAAALARIGAAADILGVTIMATDTAMPTLGRHLAAHLQRYPTSCPLGLTITADAPHPVEAPSGPEVRVAITCRAGTARSRRSTVQMATESARRLYELLAQLSLTGLDPTPLSAADLSTGGHWNLQSLGTGGHWSRLSLGVGRP